MKRALVVVDMQNDFIIGSLANSQCAAVVDEVVAVLQEQSYDDVYVTLDTHGENYLDTQEGKKLPVRHCIKGTDGWMLHEQVDKALPKEYTIFEKDGFGSMELAQCVAGKYDRIDLVGVCTGICVVSNAICIKAMDRDVEICVYEKATACVSEESKVHALETMKNCQIEII